MRNSFSCLLTVSLVAIIMNADLLALDFVKRSMLFLTAQTVVIGSSSVLDFDYCSNFDFDCSYFD